MLASEPGAAAAAVNGDTEQLMQSLQRQQQQLDAWEDFEDIDAEEDEEAVDEEAAMASRGQSLEREAFINPSLPEQQQQKKQQAFAASVEQADTEENKESDCGFWRLRPRWLQRLNQFELFLILLAVSGLCTGVQGALKSALLTKLEKRFNFDSKTSSLIVSANDMVFLPSVMLVSYFGSLGHRPRLLALSCFGYGAASVLFAAPYFLFGAQAPSGEAADIKEKLGYACSVGQNGSALTGNFSSADDSGVDAATAAERAALESRVALSFFMIAGFLEGLAAAPYWNLGVAFVDDVTGDLSGVFIGLMIGARILSPTIGYQLYGKVLVRISENLSPATPRQLSHPRYVPAWWLGFVCVGLLAMLTSFPMAMFPRMPHFNDRKYRPKSADSETGDGGGVCLRLFQKLRNSSKVERRKRSGRDVNQRMSTISANEPGAMSFAGFFASVKRLLSNPVYICLLCGNLFEFMEINCVIAYMAKYLELHFRIPSGQASMLTGIAVPGANAIGILISSFIASQVNWRVPQLAKYHACVNCFGILAAASGFFFACPSVQFVGGLQREGPTFAPDCGNGTALSALAQACDCNSMQFKPTCVNGSNYFNPCSANCYVNRGTIVCGCSGEEKFPIADLRHRSDQLCQSECSTLVYAFICVFVVIKLVRLSARSQEAVLQMRCVRPKDKALGLGINSFSFSIGGIWVPTFVGFLFDQACIFQNPSGSGGKPSRSCLFYDADTFRYSFVGFTSAALIPACSFFFLAWYFTVRDPKYTDMSSRRNTVELASRIVRSGSGTIE